MAADPADDPADDAASHPPDTPRIGPITGALLIVANMIGVGVFTTTGYMVQALGSPTAILCAWVCGGVAAFCGALAYAELGALFPRNGGEYRLLTRIYHPVVGFVTGWVTLIVGFSAPLASFAQAFGSHLEPLMPALPPKAAGAALIVLFAFVHALHVQAGSRFHNLVTLGKIGLILAFIAAGMIYGDVGRLASIDLGTAIGPVATPVFAAQLVYVSFAYSGWNTASYIAGEFARPRRDILISVLAGTTIVMLLYFGLNAIFLMAAPAEKLAGQHNVAHVAAQSLLGPAGGKLATLLIALGLVSTVSANIMSGPRVYESIGQDYPLLKILAQRRAGGGPAVAILLQSVVALGMMVTSSFDQLLNYVSVTLSLFAAATVVGVIVLRIREPALDRPYRMWGYPVTPMIFLALEAWMIVSAVRQRPYVALASAITILSGLVFYTICRRQRREG
jgi:basic amino acid/polyamine antiporter, APA family